MRIWLKKREKKYGGGKETRSACGIRELISMGESKQKILPWGGHEEGGSGDKEGTFTFTFENKIGGGKKELEKQKGMESREKMLVQKKKKGKRGNPV